MKRRKGVWGRFRRFVASLTVLVALSGGAACSGWEIEEDTCVREHSNEVTSRVVNRADPELCDRPVKKRDRAYFRVPPP